MKIGKKENLFEFHVDGEFVAFVPEGVGRAIKGAAYAFVDNRIVPLEKKVAHLEEKTADMDAKIGAGEFALKAQSALIELAHKKIDAIVEHLGLTMDFYPSMNTLTPAHYVAKKKVGKETKKGKSGGPAK